jgi:hypothetical protein
MTPRLAAVLAAAALVLSACGDDAQACFTNEIGVRDGGITGGCSAITTTAPTINLNLCPTCAQTQTRCDPDVQQNTIFLDSRVNECEGDRGCDTTSCLSRPVSCQFQGSLAPGEYTVIYLTANGSQGTRSVQVTPGGASSCTL